MKRLYSTIVGNQSFHGLYRHIVAETYLVCGFGLQLYLSSAGVIFQASRTFMNHHNFCTTLREGEKFRLLEWFRDKNSRKAFPIGEDLL
ncbi:hypothetical protein CEXT_765651 [Caerostris extrusa]|uniref:Uncharacterized protein n=1 Tax=Caerostris extrusa TaxID=172846 RepID=A0AAV4XXQ3_CAEEX|nr:hypothetical protein CEXT_765651 [Caerostris extrusa]